MENFFDRIFDKLVMPFLSIILLLILFVGIPWMGYSLYKDSTSPVFELKKSEWTCKKTYIYYTWVKGMRYEHEGCSNYTRNK